MVHKAMKFTPEVLLSAPRRSAGVPNPSGTHVLYTSSTYSFKKHEKSIELRCLDVKTGESHVLAKDDEISDLNWLDDDKLCCLQAEKDGTTSLYVASLTKVLDKSEKGTSHYVAGSIDAAASNLRVTRLSDGQSFGVVVSARATPHGALYSTEKSARKTRSSGRLYDGLYVRHWDHYETKEKNTLWYGKLSLVNGKYKLSGLTNALQGTDLESPIQPFGGADNFDIKHDALIFVSKDPKLNPALNTKCNVYLLRLNFWDRAVLQKPQQIIVPGFEGASTSPVFESNGKKAAFLSMKQNGYEADKNHIWVIPDVDANDIVTERIVSSSDASAWDRSPQSVCFTADGGALLATAEDKGFGKVFFIPTGGSAEQRPGVLTNHSYVSDVKPLTDGRIFLTASSLVDNSSYAILKYEEARLEAGEDLVVWSHSNSGGGNKFGLDVSQVSSIYTPASNPEVNKEVHSIVVKPSNFDSSKKYPVAYLIHGGPQGSWADNWSTRWNPMVFAEQGYIVVAPNPTGSTGYGQKFTDSINKNWGGDPYQDIVNCFDWVGEHVEGADNENAVALGASYGGYMVRPLSLYVSATSLTELDELDTRPRSGPQVQSSCLSRRHLQHGWRYACHRRALLPILRSGWHTMVRSGVQSERQEQRSISRSPELWTIHDLQLAQVGP